MSTPIDAFRNELGKRMDSPFWGSFIISWLLINWKVVCITISLNSISLTDKIEQIEKLYPAGNFSDFTHPLISLVIYPLLASFFAVAVIPVINHFYLWVRKEYRDWDATIEIQKIQKEKEVIKEEQDLQKEEKQLIKEKKGVLENKLEIINLENAVKKSIYEKIIGNKEVMDSFINMIQFIDKDNNQKDTVNEGLGLDDSAYATFIQFYSNNIIDYKILNPLGHSRYKYFLFLLIFEKKLLVKW